MTLDPPSLADVLSARNRIRPHLDPSPLRNYPALDRLVGAQVWVKHENLLPTGAFKVRGGVNLMSQLDSETRGRGVIAASTGNHGQSVAFAARLFGVSAIICAPEGANPVKVEAMRDLGAEVVLVGRDFDDARLHCEKLAAEHGYRYIHSGDEPDLIAGVATHTLEILEEQPDIDVILVPVGGGSGAAGACIAAKSIRSDIVVIAVQSTAASTAHDSWRAGTPVEHPNTTIAEGLATRTAFELPQRILRDMLDDFVLVTDDDLLSATAVMIEKTRSLVELAGAAPLAAALSPAVRERLAGRNVALICSGANISPAQLRTVVAG
ncbi:MAG: threonine ammonia-lyase [Candidatus Dormibacteraceae bacterium]